MPGLPEAAPFGEHEIFDTFEDDPKTAEASWALVSLVQQGRAEGATPDDIKKGEHAFAELYNRYYDTIYASILKRVDLDTHTADEFASETFLRAFKNIGGLEWQGKNVSSWLRTIAIRLVLDHYRQQSKLTHVMQDTIGDWVDESELGVPETLVVEDMHLRHQRALMRAAMERLNPEQQEVIAQHYFQGISFPEIARRRGEEPAAVKSLAWRGVQILKGLLSNGDIQVRPHYAQYEQAVVAPPAIVHAKEFEQYAAEQEVPEMQNEDDPYSDWQPPTLLSNHAWASPENAYRQALRHPLMPMAQLEEYMVYVALGHEAQSRLDSGDLQGDDPDMLQRAVQQGIESRQLVAAHYLRFALRVALRHYSAPDFEDILQEANLGLIKGVNNYDPYYQYDEDEPGDTIRPFTTNGMHYVNGGILRYLHNERRYRRMGVPPRTQDRSLLQRSYEEAKRRYPDITHEQVGAWLGFSKTVVRDLLLGKISVRTTVLVDDEPDAETIPDPKSMEPFEHIESGNMTVDEFWAFVAKNVTEQELQVLQEYYLNNKSQEAIAADKGFASRSWVGELLARAHTRLRKAANGQDPFERKRRGTGRRKDGVRQFLRKVGLPAEAEADTEELVARVEEIIASLGLTPTEQSILRTRYGIGTETTQEKSQIETAAELGLSRGYVSSVLPDIARRAKAHLGITEPADDV